MKIGIGLPATHEGIDGALILDWARQAEAGPFSSLGLIDRLIYRNYESLITLAAVAGVTQRIRLVTTILIAPLHPAAILAKQAATLDAISGGRLTLGLGVGGREDDFQAANVPFKQRGKIMDEQLATMQRIWSGEKLTEQIGPIGPTPVQNGGPEILLGGNTPAALKRQAMWGNGYIAGGGNAQQASEVFRQTEQIWQEAGRKGKPRLVGCTYFALGDSATEHANKYILDYYDFLGPVAQYIAASVATSEEAVQTRIKEFEDIGADELILWPCAAGLDQVKALSDIVGR